MRPKGKYVPLAQSVIRRKADENPSHQMLSKHFMNALLLRAYAFCKGSLGKDEQRAMWLLQKELRERYPKGYYVLYVTIICNRNIKNKMPEHMPRKSLAGERPSIRSCPNNVHGIDVLVSSGSKGRRLGRQVGIGIAGHFNLTFDRQKTVTDNNHR